MRANDGVYDVFSVRNQVIYLLYSTDAQKTRTTNSYKPFTGSGRLNRKTHRTISITIELVCCGLVGLRFFFPFVSCVEMCLLRTIELSTVSLRKTHVMLCYAHVNRFHATDGR